MDKTFRIEIHTNKIKDKLIVQCPTNGTYDDLLNAVLQEYSKWHYPTIYSFTFSNSRLNNKVLISDLIKDLPQDLIAIESKDSFKRKTQKKRQKEEHILVLKKKHIQFSKNYCLNWKYTNVNEDIQVSLDHDAMVFTNKNKYGDWITARTFYNYGLNEDVHYFEIEIINMSEKNDNEDDEDDKDKDNDIYIGVINDSADLRGNYHIGKDRSVGYNIRAGKPCYGGQNITNETIKPAQKGDVIGILIDYSDINIDYVLSPYTPKNGTIYFWKNGIPMAYRSNIGFKNVAPAISTRDYKSEFRLIVPNEDEIVARPHLSKLHDRLTTSYKKTQDHIRDVAYKMSDEYMVQITKQVESMGTIMWNPLPILQKNINMEFTDDGIFTNKNKSASFNYDDRYHYVKTLNKIEFGVAFMEFEVINKPKETRMYLGVFSEDNRYWVYKSDGSRENEGGYGDKYGEEYFTGDKVAIYLDIDSGTIEYFRNGWSQGIASTKVKGPVSFGILSGNYLESVKILPSTLDTYIEYMTKDAQSCDNWEQGNMQGFELVSEKTIKANDNNQICICRGRSKFITGRRYFEITCNNLKGNFKFGICRKSFDHQYTVDIVMQYNHFNNIHDIHDTICGLDEMDNIIDGTDNVMNDVKIGVVVDFEDRKIEVYKDGELVSSKTKEGNYGTVYGYIETDQYCSGEFTINENAETDMMEQLCLYS